MSLQELSTTEARKVLKAVDSLYWKLRDSDDPEAFEQIQAIKDYFKGQIFSEAKKVLDTP